MPIDRFFFLSNKKEHESIKNVGGTRYKVLWSYFARKSPRLSFHALPYIARQTWDVLPNSRAAFPRYRFCLPCRAVVPRYRAYHIGGTTRLGMGSCTAVCALRASAKMTHQQRQCYNTTHAVMLELMRRAPCSKNPRLYASLDGKPCSTI